MAEKPTENARGSSGSITTTGPTQPSSRAANNASDAAPRQPADSSRRQPPPPTNPAATTPSLASRVQSSAAGLARSAFQAPGSSADLARTLASGTNAKGGGSSSAAAHIHGTASQDVLSASRASAAAGQGHGAAPGSAESFRSATSTSSAQGGVVLSALTGEEFERSYADGENVVVSSGARGVSHEALQAQTGSWKGKQRAQDPVQMDYDTAWKRAQPAPTPPGADGSMWTDADGAQVVELLSDAAFDASFATAFDGTEEEQGMDLDPAASPAPLTAAEIETLESFRRSLPPSSHDPALQSQRLTSQSLIPDIDTFLQENDPQARTDSNNADVTALRDMVLSNLAGGADWLAVQESYHDEVWGYLRPALQAAQTEMEEKKARPPEEGDEGDDGPAVRRLKMILKHMRA